MKILCLLQNTWAKDPVAVQDMLARRPDLRHAMVARLLFASGCLTGRRVLTVFGEMLKEHDWTFENASTVVTGSSGGRPPYNVEHVRGVINRHRPDVILVMGTSAKEALKDMCNAKKAEPLPPVVECIHPAMRKPGWLVQMETARGELMKTLELINPASLALHA